MSWPRWIDRSENTLLREVAPGLFVGNQFAPARAKWSAVIDMYGSSSLPDHARDYGRAVLLRWSFDDGQALPPGLLDTVVPLVSTQILKGPVLIHCQAGVSRSASVAYALLVVLFSVPPSEARRRIHAVEGFPRSRTLASAERWIQSRLRS